jgi:hypothetical protein
MPPEGFYPFFPVYTNERVGTCPTLRIRNLGC